MSETEEWAVDAKAGSTLREWISRTFFSDRMRSAFFQGLVIGMFWPAFVFLCGLFYSFGKLEGTELAHHVQNAAAIYTLATFAFLLLGAGLGALLFGDVIASTGGPSERNFYRLLGYAAFSVPLVWFTLMHGSLSFYEAPKEDRGLEIELDVGKALDWWSRRKDDD